jgi:hypothetical protein
MRKDIHYELGLEAIEIQKLTKQPITECFKLAIEIKKVEILNSISKSLSKEGELIEKLDNIINALYYKK